MIMTTKAAHLKQTSNFRSLGLTDEDDLKTSLKSFSDSEIEEKSYSKRKKFRNLKKSVSENCLFQHSKENEGDVKISFCSDKKREKNKNLINSDFQETPKNLKSIAEELNYIPNEGPSSDLKNLNAETEKSSIKNQSHILPEMADPYLVLSSSNKVVGEPRCLTLKKYSGDFNPFLSDDSLSFEPDFEEEHFELDDKISHNKKRDVSTNLQIKDIFIDDEEKTQSEKKRSTLDKEEGELTPETHQAALEANKENSLTARMNADFFRKINECLLDLDKKCREFYSTSTPDWATKYLQRTLSNVDSIKRKLTFLINSKNSESERKAKFRKIVESYHISRSISTNKSEQNSKSRHSKSDRKNSDDKSGLGTSSSFKDHKTATGSSHDMKRDKDLSHKSDELEKKVDENNQDREVERLSKHGHRNSRGKLSQAYLLNRKKVNLLEKLGTKKEIQRIKSLFERQMSLITKHVIREKETNKDQNAEKHRGYHSSRKEEIDKNKERHDKIHSNDVKTLEDMEAFLDTLKNRTSDKTLSEQYIRKERNKKLFMFSSKRDKDTCLERRSNKIKPLEPAIKLPDNSKTILEDVLGKKSCLDASLNHQKNQVLDSNQVKGKKVESEVISKDISFQECPNISKKTKETCFKTPVHLSSAHLAKKKTSEQVKSDLEKMHDSELNQIHLVKDVVDLKRDLDLTSLKENETNSSLQLDKSFNYFKDCEANSSIESHHKVGGFHSTPIVDQKKTVKRKRNKSKNDEPDIDERKETNKRKRTSEDLTSKKSALDDNNLETESSPSKLESKVEKVMDEDSNSVIKDLFTKKIIILDDNNFFMNDQFCLKVINNEVYLKKISRRHKHKRSKKRGEPRETKKFEENVLEEQPKENIFEEQPKENIFEEQPKENIYEEQQDLNDEKNTNLEDMESFLEDLRSKKKVSDDEDNQDVTRYNPQCKESKFLAKIRAKRKAKLMACVSEGTDATEKEAKFLKSLEKREGDMSDSSDVESKKQKLMKKMRAEIDAIVFTEKPTAKFTGDDPLKDAKSLLNIMKEAESANDESAKQVNVSFSMKSSGGKKLESSKSGKPLSMTDESHKLLNSIRAKLKAKKASVSNVSSLMQKSEN